jgi:AcrR family transcriptional regulator
MPKIVDHFERRLQLAQAAWAIMGKSGLQGLRLGDVAREAGYTVGVLPTYFRNRADLIDASFELAADRLFDRIVARNAMVPPGADRIYNALAEWLPRPEVPESTALSIMCFAVRDDGDGAISDVYKEKSQRLLELLDRYIDEALDARAIKLRTPKTSFVRLLAIFLDGMCIRALAFPTQRVRAECLASLREIIVSFT